MASVNQSISRTVTIRRCGQLLTVEPAVPALDALRTTKIEMSSNSRQAGRLKRKLESMVNVTEISPDRNIGNLWAGLLPIVVAALEEDGYAVRHQGYEPESLPPVDQANLRHYEPLDWSVLNHIRCHDRGLIRVESGCVQAAKLLMQIAYAWPKRTMVVLVCKEKSANSTCTNLRTFGLDAAVVTTRQPFQEFSRITVATPGQLGMVGIDQRDFVIVPNAIESLRRKMIHRIVDAHRARLYGFLDRQSKLSPCERDELTMMYGLRDVIVPCHGYVDMPVEYVIYRIGGGPPLATSLDVLGLKRQGLWRHPVRNRKIARLANAFAKGGAGLLDLIPALPPGWRLEYPRRIYVLVEGLEQALHLARNLPDWPIIAGVNVDAALIPEHMRGRIRSPLEQGLGNLRKAIVTATGAELVTLSGVDVLIRADGGVGALPLPIPRCLEVPWGQGDRLLLVDFQDTQHPQLRSWSQDRVRAYAEYGWVPVGANRDQTAVERFLKARPQYRSSR
jgi:hypothetical protein